MIKLTRHKQGGRETLIMVEGRLDAQTLSELRVLFETLGPVSGVTVDLSGLTSVDPQGKSLLVELRTAGVRLAGGSLYINKLLQEVVP